jgi:sugar phosphate isomerase/epimerase
MPIPVAINQATLMQCDTEDFLRVTARTGFRSVELRMDKLAETIAHTSLRELARTRRELGLSILALHALDGATYYPDDNLDILSLQCGAVGRAAEALEIPWVITPSAMWPATRGPAPETALINEKVADRAARIASALKPFGARLALEPVGLPGFVLKSLAQTQAVIDEAGDASIGVAPDIHILTCNNESPSALSGLTSPICIIHLNDSQDLSRDTQHVVATRTFPGSGIAEPERWVKAALSAGYGGHFSLELFDESIWNMQASDAAALCLDRLTAFDSRLGIPAGG